MSGLARVLVGEQFRVGDVAEVVDHEVQAGQPGPVHPLEGSLPRPRMRQPPLGVSLASGCCSMGGPFAMNLDSSQHAGAPPICHLRM